MQYHKGIRMSMRRAVKGSCIFCGLKRVDMRRDTLSNPIGKLQSLELWFTYTTIAWCPDMKIGDSL